MSGIMQFRNLMPIHNKKQENLSSSGLNFLFNNEWYLYTVQDT